MKHVKLLIVDDSPESVDKFLRELREGGYDPVYERVETPVAMASAIGRERWDFLLWGPCNHFCMENAFASAKAARPDLPFIVTDENGNYLIKKGERNLASAFEREREEDDARDAMQFVSRCPNPLLRLGGDGVLKYANKEGLALAERWDCKIGNRLPPPWPRLAEQSLEKNLTLKTEIRKNGDILLFAVIPLIEASEVYLFGLDVTTKEAFKSLREDMLLTVSRELSAPLSLVQSALDNLKNASSNASTFLHAKMLDVIERNVRRMSLLLTDMSDLLKRDSDGDWDEGGRPDLPP